MTRREKLERLLAVMKDKKKLLILTHNNPDPDAIGSAAALQYLLTESLGVESQIAYKGIIGRSENKALVRYLGSPIKRLASADLQTDSIALVDTQPGAGNNALRSDKTPNVIIDHHPWRPQSAAGEFVDVRPEIGATCSILVEYLRAAKLSIPPMIATALYYGIKTDTLGLGRGTTKVDTGAICHLLSRIDIEAISKIENAQVPSDYFKGFTHALQTARIYKGVIISYLGKMTYPDLTAEIADFLLRMKGCRWVICMGIYKEQFILSVRTKNQQGAGQLAQVIVGTEGAAGGHGSMAGGQVLVESQDPDTLVTIFTKRTMDHLKLPADVKWQALTE